MRMRLAAAVVAVGLAATAGACGQVDVLKGRMALKDAHALYKAQDYSRAAKKYEEALANEQVAAEDPQLSVAYFYLGNCYDNLFKPARRGEAENDAYLQKAIANYKKAAEIAQDPKIKKLALEYLVAAYRDKLEDPAEAEPIVLRMIEMEPNASENYFQLAQLYENAGRYEDAEAALQKARELKPNDAAVYMQLGAYYNRQGEFDKAIEAFDQRAQREPNNPEAFQFMVPYFWEKVQKDHTLTEKQKRDYIERGLKNSDRALELKPDYVEALVYKGLLLRLQANIEKDRKKQEALLAEAKKLQERATVLSKKQQAGAQS